jgi:glycine cleavage system H lipoate-binding protein
MVKIEIWFIHLIYHSLVAACMQDHLGEVVFVELPEAGTTVSAGASFGNVESVKATSDVNSPISGEVVEVNSKLSETPGLVLLLLHACLPLAS